MFERIEMRPAPGWNEGRKAKGKERPKVLDADDVEREPLSWIPRLSYTRSGGATLARKLGRNQRPDAGAWKR